MSPKDKAKELIEKFQSISGCKRLSKIYSLIFVDEAINIVPFWDYKQKAKFNECKNESDDRFVTYWNEVKTEIEKL